MLVSSDTDARIVRYASPEVVSSCVEVPSGFAGTPSSFAKVPSSFAKVPSSFAGMCFRRGGVLPRLAGTMAVGRSRGLDVNGMGSAMCEMCSAMRGMMLVVLEMGSAACGMCLAACLADWGKQKKQFRRTASYGWQMGLEPTTFRTTI